MIKDLSSAISISKHDLEKYFVNSRCAGLYSAIKAESFI